MMRWRRTTACERAAQWISLDLDDELGSLDRAALAKHLERCAGCRALSAEIGGFTRLLRIQPLETPPPATAVQVARPRAAGNAAAGRRRSRRRHGGRGRGDLPAGHEPDLRQLARLPERQRAAALRSRAHARRADGIRRRLRVASLVRPARASIDSGVSRRWPLRRLAAACTVFASVPDRVNSPPVSASGRNVTGESWPTRTSES